MAGYVYFIGSPIFGWYKIGKSITPEVRIKDLGILLPFKVEVISVWSAQNHHAMEKALHEIYATNRINGEWFEFSRKDAYDVVNKIPAETRIYSKYNDTDKFDYFSNIDEDSKNSKRVIGVRVQKLLGDFTTEERDNIRDIAVAHKNIRKQLKTITRYATHSSSWTVACNNPYKDKRVKINIFTSLF